ncbi:ribonuclease Z [Candidatus Synechococcus spongiarum]|uniref:Ribonuclease Z n=1 Tax=Candidatus Synechococcus spongiarum TaxID=431041 RepID=A0A170T987_9SYNE|nr:ribonuclease Z [Candidatus Synechococcus spongiarum]CZB17992.1 Ribonuclease Z (EC 3.1.26.11) [Candidatus Synechococcus spongiarum]
MQVTFLGTSSGVPTRQRNVSSLAVRLPQRSEIWLLDCGEATQHQLLCSPLRVSQLRRIFITHMHGDHVFGLPGLLASLGMAGMAAGLDLYGPPPLQSFVESALQFSSTRLSYPLHFHANVPPGEGHVLFEDDDLMVESRPLWHRIPASGFRIVQKPRPGRFDVEKAKSLGLPPGPLYGRLKTGETIAVGGRTIEGTSLCGPPRPGVSLVYATDTVFCDGAVDLARGADLLIHEATFAHRDGEMALQRLHSTTTMAAQVALAAGVSKLALTHFSPRYMPGRAVGPDDLLAEARAIFPATIMARDFLTLELTSKPDE